MNKRHFLTAVRTERLFVVAIVALLGLLAANFIFVTNLLTSQSRQADHTRIDADVSSNDIKTIDSAAKKMADDPDAVKRAETVVAQSKLYEYQNQIINDLSGYAAKSGVNVGGYSFNAPTAKPGTTATPASGATTATPPAGGTASPTAGVPAGLSSTSVTVTLGQKVGYVNFLNFLKLIESNVTRMQITNVVLTPDSEDHNALASPTLTITVYTR